MLSLIYKINIFSFLFLFTIEIVFTTCIPLPSIESHSKSNFDKFLEIFILSIFFSLLFNTEIIPKSKPLPQLKGKFIEFHVLNFNFNFFLLVSETEAEIQKLQKIRLRYRNIVAP